MQHCFRVLFWDVTGCPFQLCCHCCEKVFKEIWEPAGELNIAAIGIIPLPHLLQQIFSFCNNTFIIFSILAFGFTVQKLACLQGRAFQESSCLRFFCVECRKLHMSCRKSRNGLSMKAVPVVSPLWTEGRAFLWKQPDLCSQDNWPIVAPCHLSDIHKSQTSTIMLN